jgi:uncharacterized membrane protein YbaN (DUF454 family)
MTRRCERSSVPNRRDRLTRWVLAVAGVLAVLTGGIGVVVPGLPTTVFLIIGSWCFARSCPWLEQRLIRNRFFSPYLKYLNGDAVMPVRAKIITIAIMWIFVAISAASLVRVHQGFAWPAGLIGAAAVIGTLFIARWRGRGAKPHANSRARVAADQRPAA